MGLPKTGVSLEIVFPTLSKSSVKRKFQVWLYNLVGCDNITKGRSNWILGLCTDEVCEIFRSALPHEQDFTVFYESCKSRKWLTRWTIEGAEVKFVDLGKVSPTRPGQPVFKVLLLGGPQKCAQSMTCLNSFNMETIAIVPSIRAYSA